ncbi:MAG: PH domain-containing protein [Gammaproteobacteria bacterium]|nr:PH domain-containing protein [Gammaproteobacteria bacterium]
MANRTDIEFYKEWRRTSPMAILFIAIRRFRRVVRSVIEIVSLGGLTVVLLRFLDVGLVTAILYYAVAVLAFVVISAVLSFLVLRVKISEAGIAMKSGVFRRTHKVVLWERIRSINLESGPIERIFRLVRVSVDTASSMGSEIEIPALPIFVGQHLRSHVKEPQLTDSQRLPDEISATETSEESDDQSLYELRGKNMLIAAICSKGMIFATVLGIGFVLVITSNAYLIYYQVNLADEDVPTDTTLQEEVHDKLKEDLETNLNFFSALQQAWKWSAEERIENRSKSITQLLLPLVFLLLAFVVILIPSLIIGFLVKAAIFCVSHNDYRLRQEDSKLISERGLITRKTTTVEIRNVQILRIYLTVRSRLFQRYDVKVQQSDEDDTVQSAVGNAAHQIDIPCVDSAFCREIAEQIFPKANQQLPLDPRSTEIQRFSPAYFFIGLLGVGPLILALLWGELWFLMGTRAAILWSLVLVPLGTLIWWQYWRRTGYAFYENFILLRKGFLGHDLRVIPISKLQEVRISQSIIQRLRNRCTLQMFSHSTTYTNSLKIPFMNRVFAERIRDYLLFRIESGKTRWC